MGASAESLGYGERWLTLSSESRLFYRDYGDPLSDGRPLLCLPGLARNSHDYHRFALRHAPARRVICPDYRGRGRSTRERDWRKYRPPTTIDDLRQLVASTGLHDFVAVGTSYGGLLATALGVVVPRAIAGIVLNDIGPEVQAGAQERILAYVAEARRQQDWATAERYLRRTFPDLAPRSPDAWEDFTRGTYEPDGEGGLRAQWDGAIARPFMDRPDLPDLWGLFGSLRRLPLLLVRGERSPVVTATTSRRMADAHGSMQECVVPGVGHAPMLDEPESMAAIGAFLSSVDGSTPR